ncbi:hypothetical protein [uncultured Duncaniella sp.]|uniref:hypothetical protein n=1 Tax=uncultured Duncaniella sp. TaxID=2768039 RepID=UPI0025B704FD|nr:hypothetical protein [uncultured Duncaniella sp.]
MAMNKKCSRLSQMYANTLFPNPVKKDGIDDDRLIRTTATLAFADGFTVASDVWHDPKKEMPEDRTEILLAFRFRKKDTGTWYVTYMHERFHTTEGFGLSDASEVLAWMYVPELPKSLVY